LGAHTGKYRKVREKAKEKGKQREPKERKGKFFYSFLCDLLIDQSAHEVLIRRRFFQWWSLVQQMMAGNPNWWSMHPPSSIFPSPYVHGSTNSLPQLNSFPDQHNLEPPQSWSQLLL
jgi:hypothetical protein